MGHGGSHPWDPGLDGADESGSPSLDPAWRSGASVWGRRVVRTCAGQRSASAEARLGGSPRLACGPAWAAARLVDWASRPPALRSLV